MDVAEYKAEFIQRALDNGVLLFGEFTLKSGRTSPYFFNAGRLYTGSLLASTASAFAAALLSPRIANFDVLLGPAYKGIPLAAITTAALYNEHKLNKEYCYNRKEKKDHGEGGELVGAPLKGDIVIIDDVLTRGVRPTNPNHDCADVQVAVRESIALLAAHPEARLVGIVQLVDRQERGQGDRSTVQEIESEFNVPVVPIIGMSDIMAFMEQKGGYETELIAMKKYREEYGIQAV